MEVRYEYAILTVSWRPLANTFVQASGGVSLTDELLVQDRQKVVLRHLVTKTKVWGPEYWFDLLNSSELAVPHPVKSEPVYVRKVKTHKLVWVCEVYFSVLCISSTGLGLSVDGHEPMIPAESSRANVASVQAWTHVDWRVTSDGWFDPGASVAASGRTGTARTSLDEGVLHRCIWRWADSRTKASGSL